MADAGEAIGKATKLPFANYDIVVYFGVGICSLPFFSRYILAISKSKRLPIIFDGYSDPLINNIISIVALTFGVYIIGHGISILSSLFIEQFVHRTVGPPSKIITRSLLPDLNGSHSFISHIRAQSAETYTSPASADIFRVIFHIPVIPVYAFMLIFRLFGFYESKVSSFVVARVQTRLESGYDYPGNILINPSWFKIIEYACANDHPSAMSKMYNYLLIYGLFRSISFLILCSAWCEIYFWCTQGGLGFLEQSSTGSMAFRSVTICLAYWVSFVGYGKFSRRYAEEAVQAFALSDKFKPILTS